MATELSKRESLEQEADHVIEEARMVLPGIQALFGFQLIAVFNTAFATHLAAPEQVLHLVAIFLVVLAIGLIMAPAAYHRQAEPGIVTRDFVRLGSRLITWALAALLFAISLDFFLVARIIAQRTEVSVVLAGIVFLILIWLWFVFPQIKSKARGSAK